MRGAHEDNRTLLWHLPTTSWMHFSKKELHQDREGPQEGIVDVFVHDRELLALGISLRGRHDGYLNHKYAAGECEDDDMRRQKGEIGVASYGCWCAVVRGLESDCDGERGAASTRCAHCETELLTMKLRWELQCSRWLASERRFRHVVVHLHVLALSPQVSREEEHQATAKFPL
jgi:hypothetical protein